jgi:hypothetical protein
MPMLLPLLPMIIIAAGYKQGTAIERIDMSSFVVELSLERNFGPIEQASPCRSAMMPLRRTESCGFCLSQKPHDGRSTNERARKSYLR